MSKLSQVRQAAPLLTDREGRLPSSRTGFEVDAAHSSYESGSDNRSRRVASDTINVGIGLRGPHIDDILETRPKIGWFEIHTENYFGGGLALAQLDAIRRDHSVSLHGVGLSLGSSERLDLEHLGHLAAVMRRVDPFLISEHLAWSIVDETYLNDLLPLPYTEESLQIVAANVTAAQDFLRRPILVENPASYLRFRHSTIPEAEFLGELAVRTGCGILCDVNNLYVSCVNLDFDPHLYLAALPTCPVGEIHLAGHSHLEQVQGALLIDDHGSCVAAAVLELYQEAVTRFGAAPTLIEWDNRLPKLSILLHEARKAEAIAHAALRGDSPAC